MKNLLQQMILSKGFKRYAILVSQLLIIATLAQDSLNSLWVFVFGWLGLYYSWTALAWLANPFLIIAWRTFKSRPEISMVFSLLAVVTALFFLFFRNHFDLNSEQMYTTTGFSNIYWIWLSACGVMLIANVSSFMVKKPVPDVSY
jgi:hypothetical protein